VNIVGNRTGPIYPDGAKVGDTKARGIQSTDFTFENSRCSWQTLFCNGISRAAANFGLYLATLFDALVIVSGNEQYINSLGQGRVVHYARESFGHLKPILVLGTAVDWYAHRVLPGKTDYKAPPDDYASKNGIVLARKVSSEDASFFGKVNKHRFLGF
jgi:hypothetical protein